MLQLLNISLFALSGIGFTIAAYKLYKGIVTIVKEERLISELKRSTGQKLTDKDGSGINLHSNQHGSPAELQQAIELLQRLQAKTSKQETSQTK